MTLNNKKDKIENLEDAIDAHNKDWATIKGSLSLKLKDWDAIIAGNFRSEK